MVPGGWYRGLWVGKLGRRVNNYPCKVARGGSRRDVLHGARGCVLHGARGCVLHGARGCGAIRLIAFILHGGGVLGISSSVLGLLQWNMFQNRFRQRNLEHSDPW